MEGFFQPQTEVCSGSPGPVVWPALSYDTVVERVQGLSCLPRDGRGRDKVYPCRAFPQSGPLSIISQHGSTSWGPHLQCMSPGGHFIFKSEHKSSYSTKQSRNASLLTQTLYFFELSDENHEEQIQRPGQEGAPDCLRGNGEKLKQETCPKERPK